MIKVDVRKLLLERAEQGLTIDALSRKSGVGRSTISRIEKGDVEGRLTTIAKIAKGLGKSVEDFLGEDVSTKYTC